MSKDWRTKFNKGFGIEVSKKDLIQAHQELGMALYYAPNRLIMEADEFDEKQAYILENCGSIEFGNEILRLTARGVMLIEEALDSGVLSKA